MLWLTSVKVYDTIYGVHLAEIPPVLECILDIWPGISGMGGREFSESVADFDRNFQTSLLNIISMT